MARYLASLSAQCHVVTVLERGALCRSLNQQFILMLSLLKVENVGERSSTPLFISERQSEERDEVGLDVPNWT